MMKTMGARMLIAILSLNFLICSGFAAVNATVGKYERTLVLIKPDSLQRGLVGEIMNRFEKKGLKLVALKFMWATEELIAEHYQEMSHREFFPDVVKQMTSGPLIPLVWEGKNAVEAVVKMKGIAVLTDVLPGTIRADYCIDRSINVVHSSHSVEDANREIRLWFRESELVSWTMANDYWLHD